MTLFKVIDLIKILALKHPNVNSAEEGDIYSILNANTQQKYASVVLTQDTHTEDEVFDNYNFNIFYVDRLFSDIETNRLDIQSTAKNVLSNIIRAFCEEFDAECNSINYHTFTERFADECAGAYAAITISIPKDIYCTEKYWDGNWSAPVISIKNQNKRVEFTENGTFTITYDNENFTGLGTVEVEVNVEDTNGSYEEGYTNGLTDGIADGIYHQKSKLESITITENGVYEKEDGYDEITVNVIDTNGSYEDGYLDGETDGYNDGLADGIGEGRSYQKSLLESITITENGTYTKEDGYNQITVNIEDVNGSYEEGYEEGIENAGEIIAENAQVLNVTQNGIYTTKYSNVDSGVTGDYTGDNLIKTVNVNVIPKMNMQKIGLKLAFMNTTEIPEWADFEGITDMSNMFRNNQFTSIPLIDTSKVRTMNNMFTDCKYLTTIPQLDTSKVTDMSYMFSDCTNLTTIPQLDTSNVTTISSIFYYCSKLTSIAPLNVSKLISNGAGTIFGYSNITTLTDFGGFIDLKISMTLVGFEKLPNLTYQSCINILNGLHDFTGNGETPLSYQGKLKVHANFLSLVGDEISIGTNKGWTITA